MLSTTAAGDAREALRTLDRTSLDPQGRRASSGTHPFMTSDMREGQ
jgi:hypothetical protein